MSGAILRDAGVDLVSEHNPDWVSDAASLIRLMAETREQFTSDDVRSVLPVPPHPNCLGAAFRIVSQSGGIRRVGFTTSRTASAHARVVGVWARTEDSQ